MQSDNQHRHLSNLLDELGSNDVAPNWRKDEAWETLEQRLKRKPRRSLPLWSYAAAAALAAILLLVLFPKRQVPDVTIEHSFPQIQKHITSTDSIPVVSAANQPRVRNIPRKAEVDQRSVHQNKHATSVPVETTELPSSAEQHVEVPAIASTQAEERPPQVVYTLNEIMDNVPEREAPPIRSTGLFPQKPILNADYRSLSHGLFVRSTPLKELPQSIEIITQ